MSPDRTGALAAAQVRDAAPLFAALGDETRIRLLLRLSSAGPQSTTSLTARASVSRQAVAKHLDVLSRAGLVRDQRRGRERIWLPRGERLADARGYLDRISRQWDEALARLKAAVEG
jgi:DNA-binding transcriptional ArsR family regulator